MYITHPSTKHGSNRDHKASRTPRTGTGEEGEEDVYIDLKKWICLVENGPRPEK